MRIEVIGRGLDITDAIRTYAESKVEHIGKFFDGVSSTIVTITKADHHHKGEYDAEIVSKVPKHDPFVCHAKHEDVYAAIDQAAQKAARQVTEYKNRLREGNR